METIEITARTKGAVRAWAGLEPTAPLVLDARLEALLPGALNALLTHVNAAFLNQPSFPITLSKWTELAPKTVRAVRDACKKRMEAN